MKKVLMLGNDDARYHPLPGVSRRILTLLGDEAQITCSQQAAALESVDQYDLCICYFEFGGAYTDEQTAALLRYVAGGGALLALHNGIALQSRPELCQLLGGKFTHHPDYDGLPMVPYRVEAPDHPIMQGVADFTIADEQYMFVLDALDDKQMLLGMDYQGQRYPAGWVRRFGKGHVVYFACGHNAACFDDAQLSKIVYQSFRWLTGGQQT
ncbi:MAG: ThuA domain-containing protein [Eubacteriales bacterium]|nr:ThuA domain-containing protein [Eubacteriales bacterium]